MTSPTRSHLVQALLGQQDPGSGLEPQLEPQPQAWMENQDVGNLGGMSG